MSTSGSGDYEETVDVDDLNEEAPVQRKHCNKLLHEVHGLASTMSGFSSDLKLAFTRLNKLDGKGTATSSDKKSTSKSKAESSVSASATSTAKRPKGAVRKKPPVVAGAQPVKAKKRAGDHSSPVVRTKRQRKGPGKNSTPTDHSTQEQQVEKQPDLEMDHQEEDDEEEEGFGKDFEVESDVEPEDSQPEDSQPEDSNEDGEGQEELRKEKVLVVLSVSDGGPPVIDMNESAEHGVKGKVFRQVSNGPGLFLHYTIPDNYTLMTKVVDELVRASLKSVDCTCFEEAVSKEAVGRLIAEFGIKVLRHEIGKKKGPIYLMKEMLLADVFDADSTVDDILSVQPEPIKMALQELIEHEHMVDKMSEDALVDSVLQALPIIKDEVVAVRGGLEKLGSPTKQKPKKANK